MALCTCVWFENFEHQGHLVCAPNNRVPPKTTPTWDPSFIETPTFALMLHRVLLMASAVSGVCFKRRPRRLSPWAKRLFVVFVFWLLGGEWVPSEGLLLTAFGLGKLRARVQDWYLHSFRERVRKLSLRVQVPKWNVST